MRKLEKYQELVNKKISMCKAMSVLSESPNASKLKDAIHELTRAETEVDKELEAMEREKLDFIEHMLRVMQYDATFDNLPNCAPHVAVLTELWENSSNNLKMSSLNCLLDIDCYASKA